MKLAAGTVGRTCAILDSLIRGAVHDRHTIAKDFGCNVGAADRYIRELQRVAGVMPIRQGRRHSIKFYFWWATRAAGV